MKIAVLGTGVVGQTIGTRLTGLGIKTIMGSRTATNEKAIQWSKLCGPHASATTFSEAASQSDLIINCLNGMATLEGLKQAGKKNLSGKVLIDVANPLDFSKGFPPSLSVSNTDSLGEQVQREFTDTYVVKALNTMNCQLMVHPEKLPGTHHVFLCGNHEPAKVQTRNLLERFGWGHEQIIDLGDITGARGMEQILPLWIRLYGTFKHANFNFSVLKG